MPSVIKERGERFNDDDPRVVSASFLGAAGTFDRPVFIAPVDGRLTGGWIYSDTTSPAHNTNFWTFNVQNGSTEMMIDIATTVSGLVLTADVPREFTLSATTADRNFSAGDDIRFFATESATAQDLVAAWLNITLSWVPR